MGKCVNPNHPDIIRLSNETGLHVASIPAKISYWQEQNNNDEFPTKSQLTLFADNKLNFSDKVKNFFKQFFNSKELHNFLKSQSKTFYTKKDIDFLIDKFSSK